MEDLDAELRCRRCSSRINWNWRHSTYPGLSGYVGAPALAKYQFHGYIRNYRSCGFEARFTAISRSVMQANQSSRHGLGPEQPRFGNDGTGSPSLAYLLIIITINVTHTGQMIIKTTIFIAAACSLRNNTRADLSN